MRKYELIIFLTSAFSLTFCNQKLPEGALVISDNDTMYPQDILSISKKINQNPIDPEKYYLRGNAFYYLDDYKHASIDFKTATKLNPQNALYFYRLAESYLAPDSAIYVEANRALETAISIKRDYNEAIFLAAKVQLARQQYDKAEEYLKKIIEIDGFKENSRLLMSVLYKEKKDTSMSEKFIDDLLKVNPENFDANMQKALFLIKKDSLLAEQFVDKALVLDEYSDEALYTKALLLQRKGRFEDALNLYKRVQKINPQHLYSYYNSAVIQALFENFQASIDLCNEVLKLSGRFDNAYTLRGFCYQELGDKKTAEQNYTAALEINPSSDLAQSYLNSLK